MPGSKCTHIFKHKQIISRLHASMFNANKRTQTQPQQSQTWSQMGKGCEVGLMSN